MSGDKGSGIAAWLGDQEGPGAGARGKAISATIEVAGSHAGTCRRRRLFYWSCGEATLVAAVERAAQAAGVELCVLRDPSLLVAARMDERIVVEVSHLRSAWWDQLGQLRAEGVAAPLVIIAGRVDLLNSYQMLRYGVHHVFMRPVEEPTLSAYVKESLWQCEPPGSWLVEYQRLRSQWGCLTAKECQAVDLLVDGWANKQIARRLGITIRAVELRRAAAMRKLNVSSIAELFQLRLRLRWLSAFFHGPGG